MNKYLEKDMQKLETMDKLRQMNIVEHTLDAVMEQVENKETEINELFGSTMRKGEAYMGVMEFITMYIASLLDGKMLVNEYIEKNKSKQQVWLFLYTHWEVVDMQLFYVFVKRCTSRMGLKEIFCDDPDFMGKLFLRILFKLMDYRKQKIMPGDVWVNVQNGTLELHADGSVVLREHRAEDFFTYVLPYSYDPHAECPLWYEFLNKVLPEAETQLLLAEFIGYCFTKNLKLEKMGVFYGTGSNGKSVCLDIITMLLGCHNVSNISLSALTMDDEKRSLIEGKLANISHESKGELDTAMLKQIVSGEPTEVRRLYIGTHKMTDIPKLFTSYNRLPSAEYTFGFFRRWLLFPFRVTIPEHEQDVNLAKKLSLELSGILNWTLHALSGLIQRKAFSNSATCSDALKEYINTSNSAMQFVSTRCTICETSMIKLADLYKAYTTFCAEEDFKKIGKKNFQEIIESFGAKAFRAHNSKYYHITIKNDESQ